MQAVILAAGEGKRMRPLTLERPKPLVQVAGRPILEYVIDALPPEVDEIILVVGYKGDMIKTHFGSTYKGRSISYVHQWMAAGTAHALSMAAPLLKEGRFAFLFADDIHGPDAFTEALTHPLALLVATHEDPSKFGVVSLNEDNTLAHIVEKPKVPETNLISTGAMILDTRIFDYEATRHESGEFFLTDPLSLFAKEHPIKVVSQNLWIPIGYPEDIENAERQLREREGVL